LPSRRAGAIGLLSIFAVGWMLTSPVLTQNQEPTPPFDP
jgi:hypothetical protein